MSGILNAMDSFFGNTSAPTASGTGEGSNSQGDEVKTPENSLAKMGELWENDPNATAAPEKPAKVFGDINNADLMNAASKIDFTNYVDNTLLDTVRAGGEEATTAMLQVINRVQQAGYAQSAAATAALIENAVEKVNKAWEDRLPSLLNKVNTSTAIGEDPILSNPAIKPLAQMVSERIQSKYPTASAKEIATTTARFLRESVGTSFNLNEVKSDLSNSGNKAKPVDWDNFFNS